MHMKKILTLTLLFLLLLTWIPICKGNFSVYPLELSVIMNNEFIQGNTSKNIRITNNNDYNINVSWYLDHPDPTSWMRPNKTFIPSLPWIDVNPRWCVVPPHDSKDFYIYLDVPNSDEYTGQNWETWVTFKQESSGSIFNQEYTVRVYIDTPREVVISNNQDHDSLSIAIGDQIKVPLLDIVLAAVIATILLIIVTLVIKKKKS